MVVEDDELVLAALTRRLRNRWPLRTATSASAARELLTQHDDWVGFLIDAGLPEGPLAGLALLGAIRETYPHTPAAIITGRIKADVVNGADALDAYVIMKDGDITELVERLLSRIDQAAADPIVGVRDAAAREHGLTPREAQLLEWFLRGNDAASFARHEGLARDTVKDHQEGLLRKTGQRTYAALVARLLAESRRRAR